MSHFGSLAISTLKSYCRLESTSVSVSIFHHHLLADILRQKKSRLAFGRQALTWSAKTLSQLQLTQLDAFVLMRSYNIFLADQGNDRIDWRESRMLIGTPQRLTPSTALTMVPQAGTRGTGPSDRTFNYASQIKLRKATEQRGSRLKDEEYRTNMVYLKTHLKRSTDIEWDDHIPEQYHRTLSQQDSFGCSWPF